MALDFDVAVKVNGSEHQIDIDATEVAAGDELGPFAVPERGRIKLVLCRLESGTGATVDPELWRRSTSDDTPADEVAGDSTLAPAATVLEVSEVPYHAPDKQLWLRPNVNAGNDNAVHAEVLILGGLG